VAVNLLMVMGFAPVVGIPLPFMSHGGSSMLTNMICIGALMMVDRWNKRAPGRGLSGSLSGGLTT
jgi:rod shape determining protein RodA